MIGKTGGRAPYNALTSHRMFVMLLLWFCAFLHFASYAAWALTFVVFIHSFSIVPDTELAMSGHTCTKQCPQICYTAVIQTNAPDSHSALCSAGAQTLSIHSHLTSCHRQISSKVPTAPLLTLKSLSIQTPRSTHTNHKQRVQQCGL